MKPKHARLPRSTSSRHTDGGANLSPSKAAKKDSDPWQKRCSQLQKECDQLRSRLAEVLAQRAEYAQIICDLVDVEKVQFDEDDVLAPIGRFGSFEDLLKALAADVGAEATHRKKKA